MGSYAYVAAHSAGLRVIDVSNPASPTEVGFCATPGYAYDVAVAGRYAYVADGDAGLRVVDVSNPSSPTEIGSCDTPGTCEGVAVAGSYAFVADGDAGLRIIDVSNPSRPAEVGFYDTPWGAYGVAVAQGYAYVADGFGGLFVLRFSATVPTVLVRDESGSPVSGAEVFRNGQLAGTTGPDGQLSIPGLAAGDQLVARLRVMERPAVKGSHEGGSSQNWAYRVYITSLDVPSAGEPTPWVVSDPRTTQVLTIKKGNALIGFNIVASVEWDANSQYLEELKQAFQRASEYLYDATDGQMLLERVTIHDNNQHMADADYQIRASNQEWPHVPYVPADQPARRFYENQSLHIFLGRYFDGQSANQGSWAAPNGYRTQVHEFGHYGLGLRDSYFYYDKDGRHDGACTSADIRTNGKFDVNATLMYYSYEASEFSMRGVSGMWSNQCERTDQWNTNGESDWETIVRHYRDSASPERWELKTPASYGSVVAGPHLLPVGDWQAVVIGSNASTGVCEPPITWRAKYRGAEPAAGA
ncbi:MAG: hypothetical protein K6V36_15585, partial [Anaerolineae bacterium]|nr:hypothetical protein [Anaerolineae bacterium]